MRLGGPVFGETSDPDGWAAAVKSHGYSAAYCPVNSDSDEATIDAYIEAAKKSGHRHSGGRCVEQSDQYRRYGTRGCARKV